MTPDKAGSVIVTSLAATAAIATVTVVRSGQVPGPRIVVGAIAAGVILNTVADVAPGPAAGLAVVILVGSIVGASGAASIGAIGQAISGRKVGRYEQAQRQSNPSFYGQ